MSPTNLKPLAWIRQGDCIICTSHKTDTDGYPSMRRNGGKYRKIARWILLRRHGDDLPRTVIAMHSCDNKACISPAHITAGTVTQNNRDAFGRGLNQKARRPWQ